jgi:tRNA (guanine37-N1)-methyltransferase
MKKMKIDILTLFPDMFKGPFDASIIKRAESKDLVEIKVHDLRNWGDTERRNVDDRPYGGGVGMLIRIDVMDRALKDLKKKGSHVVVLDATGKRFTQKGAVSLTEFTHLILIAGHYEGIDHRVHEHLADEVISVGDFVLTGGEIPAMLIVDSVIRLLPGVLGKDESSAVESHMSPGYLEYPQYTRPEKYKKWNVPKVLLTGNHSEIEKWRNEESAKKSS